MGADAPGSAEPRGQVIRVSDAGVVALHAEREAEAFAVAPVRASEPGGNRIRSSLLPRACWKVEDAVFEFDSSFISFSRSLDVDALKDILDRKPGSKLSIFGHADPVGRDDYNKVLSGRRARAVFGMLLQDPKEWRALYDEHDTNGKDRWGLRAIQIMLNVVAPEGSAPVRTDGELDDPTRAKLREFQSSGSLPPTPFGRAPDHKVDAATFDALAAAYQKILCRTDGQGNTLKLERSDFLAQGKGRAGKGDFQGCGEFNPVLVFSGSERKELDRKENHAQRNRENQPNRRVMVLVFRPGSQVDPTRWPCPSAAESGAGCRARFFRKVPGSDFPDGDARRANGAERREYEKTRDTFACRFYDRMLESSPCEDIVRSFRLRLFDRDGRPAENTPFEVEVDGRRLPGTTRAGGVAIVRDTVVPDECTVRWSPLRPAPPPGAPPPAPGFEFEARVFIDTEVAPGERMTDEEARRRLVNMGYVHSKDPKRNLKAFERECGRTETGELANAEALLRRHHDEEVAPPFKPARRADAKSLVEDSVGDSTADLDAGAGTPVCPPHDEAFYRARAYENAFGPGNPPGSWTRERAVDSATARIKKLYAYYAGIFLKQPDVLIWMGLGRLAGASVVRGLRLPLVSGDQIEAVVGIAKAIFEDMGWQHEAFMDGACGPDIVKRLAAESDRKAPRRGVNGRPAFYRVAWEKITRGAATGSFADAVAGNLDLAEIEQWTVVQDGYDDGVKKGLFGGLLAPISAASSQLHPYHRDFVEVVTGDVIKAPDRWRWITETDGMWEKWTNADPDMRPERIRLATIDFERVIGQKWEPVVQKFMRPGSR